MIGTDRELGELATWIEDSLGEPPTDAVAERQREQVPGYFDGSSEVLDVGARVATASLLRAICAGLRAGREAPAHLPPGAVEQAEAAAAEGIPWAVVARAHAVGHAVVWEQVIAELERREVEAGRVTSVLQVVSRYLFAFVDRVTSELGDVYARERERLVRDTERRKGSVVRDVLAGLPIADGQLGYELRSEHVAAIVWARGPRTPSPPSRPRAACAR